MRRILFFSSNRILYNIQLNTKLQQWIRILLLLGTVNSLIISQFLSVWLLLLRREQILVVFFTFLCMRKSFNLFCVEMSLSGLQNRAILLHRCLSKWINCLSKLSLSFSLSYLPSTSIWIIKKHEMRAFKRLYWFLARNKIHAHTLVTRDLHSIMMVATRKKWENKLVEKNTQAIRSDKNMCVYNLYVFVLSRCSGMDHFDERSVFNLDFWPHNMKQIFGRCHTVHTHTHTLESKITHTPTVACVAYFSPHVNAVTHI